MLSLSSAARRCLGHPLHSVLQHVDRQPVRWEVRLKKRLSDDARRSGGSERNPNKRLQRTGISVSLIDNLPHDAVVARPLKRSVRCLLASYTFGRIVRSI